jgi:hypothetical protein
MKTSDILFVGIKGSVMALNRASGQPVWTTPLKGSSFVNLLVEKGQIFASTEGEVFCLNPLGGEVLWHNPLKGYGFGLASMATEASGAGAQMPLAEQARQEEESSASTTVAAAG